MFKSEALKKIEMLHPEKDAWEIIRLSMYYEFPWDYNRALELALHKTYAVPSISATLARSKEFEKHTQKRYDDTDLLLSEVVEHGLEKGSRGWQALQQINWIHANYKISNDDYLYVLGTFIFEVSHWINNYAYRTLTPNEELAGFYVWKQIGEQMNIKNVPATISEFEKFYYEYENKHFTYSPTNAQIAKYTEDLLLSWYLPSFMFEAARPFLHAVMQPNLLKAFNHKEPGTALRNFVKNTLRARSKAANFIPNNKPFIRTKDNKYRTYPNGYELADLGPEKLMKSAACPFHKTAKTT